MRSNSRAAQIAAWGVLLIALSVMSLLRPEAAAAYETLKAKSDVYALPSPEQTLVASLGYRDAVADFLFAHVLVSQGLHHSEKRRYEFVGEYLDTINALAPKFRDPYILTDVLVIMSAEAPRLQEYLKAREILRRGTENLPYDARVWLAAGQFLRFLAPPWLEDPELKEEFREEGQRAMLRACDLGSGDVEITNLCVAAAHLLEQAGQRQAAIDAIRRLLAITDEPHVQQRAMDYLELMLSEEAAEQARRRKEAFQERWGKDLTFVSKDTILVLGPRFDPARCAGTEHVGDPECVTSWRDWGRQFETPALEGVALPAEPHPAP